ncbi:hypothetical protein R3Q06_28915 [Rhodococcus erythropolis]|uniref:hypothetical protein n=1 Tax=Rhodococcus erythropolis TaxID=1833 RepID=UPI002949B7A6|nr:hypothetical protein [Rhodococcus erythropolis]MDV6277519.1 hypothetical protein [Rhodococcus erythropolis]
MSSTYKGFRFPREVISHCVWLYHRFPLSLREIELMVLPTRSNSAKNFALSSGVYFLLLGGVCS